LVDIIENVHVCRSPGDGSLRYVNIIMKTLKVSGYLNATLHLF